MMMEHDPGPMPETLAPETLKLLHTALGGYVSSSTDAEDLRAALHTVAAEARAKRMLPEQLLVTLKDTWYGLPNVRSISQSDEQVRLLQSAVTMCIKEYYR